MSVPYISDLSPKIAVFILFFFFLQALQITFFPDISKVLHSIAALPKYQISQINGINLNLTELEEISLLDDEAYDDDEMDQCC